MSTVETSEGVAVENVATKEKDFPKQGLVRASLLDIDPTVFKNYRSEVTEDHVEELCRSLKMNTRNEQLQNCGGDVRESEIDGVKVKKLGLAWGFCRFEAMQRNALKKLVDEWNNTHDLDPNDDGFINVGGKGFNSRLDRLQIREAGGEWQTKYDEALDKYPINISIKPMKDDHDAALANMVENESSQKPPLHDLVTRVAELSAEGLKQDRIAVAMSSRKSYISQLQRISDFPATVMERWGNEDEDGNVSLNPRLECAMQEWERRLKIPKSDNTALKFSHARDTVLAIDHARTPMDEGVATDLLCRLLWVDSDGKPQTEKDVLGYTVLKSAIEAAKKTQKAGGDSATSVDNESNEEGSEEGSDVDVQDVNTDDLIDAGDVDSDVSTEDIDTEDVTVDDLSEDQQEGPSDSDLESIEGGSETAGEVSSDSDDEDTSDIAPESSGDVAPPSSEKNVSTIDAKPVGTQVKRPDIIAKQATECLKIAASENATILEIAANAFGAGQIFFCLGQDDNMEVTNFASVNFMEECEDYIARLETLCKENCPKEFEAIQKPRWEMPSFE